MELPDTPLRILILEDSPTDAELMERELHKGGIAFTAKCVDTLEAFAGALEAFRPDLVLSDYHLSGFQGIDALQKVRRDHPDIPVIFVTGALPDVEAVELLHAGAKDYVLKDRLARLPAAVQRAWSAEQGIRARKAAERELRESEENFRAVFEQARDGIVFTDAESGLVMNCNSEFERQCGRPLAQIKTLHTWELRPTELQEAARRKFEEVKVSGHGSIDSGFQRPDGTFMPADIVATRVRIADRDCIMSISRDTTERKQIEAIQKFLAESGYSHADKNFFQLLAKFLAQILEMDYVCIDRLEGDQLSAKTVAIYYDGKFEDNVSYTLKDTPCGDVVAKRVCCFTKDVRHLFPRDAVLQEMLAESYVGTTLQGFDGKLNGLIAVIGRKPLANPALAEMLLQMVSVRAAGELERQKSEDELRKLLDAANQARRVMLSVIQDQKKADAATQHANRALATLSAVNRTLVRSTSEEELLQSICQAIVTQRGYQLAWVGYVQHDENKSIKIMAHASEGGGYPDTMQPTWAEKEHGMGPSGRAVRSGATQLCQDIANDPHYSPWRDEALQRGYAASISLSLLNGDNTVFGILSVYAAEVNAFTSTEIDLLEEMAGDLAFGVLTLHTRRERDLALVKNQEQLVQLQDSLEDTVRAIATIVEMRDPYTAGHQIRVADLASAIAKQMGLSDEQIHTVHLAGVVHDLGKINIPAEILSKPGKITEIEFSLIKVHPQAGFDILKDIDFPWPIAQMVLQHHERLDGSGYPQGLKGDAILLEARILSVADVVEAMSSHRPYRPGLGVEASLAEISKQRGIYFDPQVVDACLVVFREQGYTFK